MTAPWGTSQVEQKRVLLLGAGGRAKSVVLPALHCMREQWSLAAVVTRTPRPISLFGGEMEFVTVGSLRECDLGSVDVVIVATTLESVPGIVKELAGQPVGHVTLLLDTPVLPRKSLATAQLFPRFKDVLVSEDCIALPPYVVAKRLIDEGRIGRVRCIYSFHNDYKYHALASMKYLTDSRHIRSIVWSGVGAGVAEATIRMPAGPLVRMLEPRDYGIGRFLVVGDRGFIADYPLRGVGGLHIDYRLEQGRYRGLTVNGESCAEDDLDRMLGDSLPGELQDGSLRTTLKIRGFMSILDGATNPQSPFRYSPEAGLYDMAAIACVERFSRFHDFGLGDGSVITALLRMLSRSGRC